jgi:hypothetical protein
LRGGWCGEKEYGEEKAKSLHMAYPFRLKAEATEFRLKAETTQFRLKAETT